MAEIRYSSDPTPLRPENVEGFFVGWPTPPDAATLVRILAGSDAVWLALDGARVVGFINALTDGVLNAFIPLLEVLPEYQGSGIGGELVRRMTESLGDIYAIDLVCDEGLVPFYEGSGYTKLTAMARRNYAHQRGKQTPT